MTTPSFSSPIYVSINEKQYSVFIWIRWKRSAERILYAHVFYSVLILFSLDDLKRKEKRYCSESIAELYFLDTFIYFCEPSLASFGCYKEAKVTNSILE